MAVAPPPRRSAWCARDYEYFLKLRAENNMWGYDVIGVLPAVHVGVGVLEIQDKARSAKAASDD